MLAQAILIPLMKSKKTTAVVGNTQQLDESAAKKTLEIRGFLEIPDEGSIYGPDTKNLKTGSRYRF